MFTSTQQNVILLLDGEGSVIADKSPAGRVVTTGSGATISTAQKIEGNSSILLNNTVNGFITFTPQLSLSLADSITLDFWIYLLGRTDYPFALEIGPHAGSSGIAFLVDSPNGICLYSAAVSGGFIGQSNTFVPLNTWTKLRYVITTINNQRRAYIYRNNVLINSPFTVISTANTFTGPCNISRADTSTQPLYFINGYIDSYTIYSDALII